MLRRKAESVLDEKRVSRWGQSLERATKEERGSRKVIGVGRRQLRTFSAPFTIPYFEELAPMTWGARGYRVKRVNCIKVDDASSSCVNTAVLTTLIRASLSIPLKELLSTLHLVQTFTNTIYNWITKLPRIILITFIERMIFTFQFSHY